MDRCRWRAPAKRVTMKNTFSMSTWKATFDRNYNRFAYFIRNAFRRLGAGQFVQCPSLRENGFSWRVFRTGDVILICLWVLGTGQFVWNTYHWWRAIRSLRLDYLTDSMCSCPNLSSWWPVWSMSRSKRIADKSRMITFKLWCYPSSFNGILTVFRGLIWLALASLTSSLCCNWCDISVFHCRALSGNICCCPWYQMTYNGGSIAPLTTQWSATRLPSFT